jgi:HAE1 family hydrophobic/amphiphilic exporter-1
MANEVEQNIEKKGEHKSSDYLYLEKLTFRPELRKSFLNFFIVNFRVVILLIALITLWGVYSFIKLPLESDPEVKIPIAVVATVYPGASPADVEEQVTKKVETSIAGLKDIKKITSSSANSISAITVEFDASANLDDSLRKLKDNINNVKNDIPTDANDPVVNEISVDDSPIFTAALTGPFDGKTMREYAKDIKDELEKIPGVREVNVSGGDENEFKVAYDPQKLTFYNISPDQANQAVKGVNLAVPAGIFEGTKYSYPIRVDSRFFDADKLRKIPITHTEDGAIVYLGDIATVSETAIKRTVLSRFSSVGENPKNDVTIQVIKKTGGSIVETADAAKSSIEDTLKKLPNGLNYDITLNRADLIRDDFTRLKHDFTLTLILVFAILFLIVGMKEAVVAGLAIPLVFFVTFGVMLLTGITLNFLSMFSLILALGLLVDDAIVVVSATKQYLRTGKFTPEEAILLVLNDFKIVLTTTTLTTVWAFLPLLSASGIIGQYLKSIPITVSVTLIASLIIALIINHPLSAILERIRLTKKMFFGLAVSLLAFAGLLAYAGSWYGYAAAVAVFLIIVKMTMWYRAGGKGILAENLKLTEMEWRSDDLIKQKLLKQGGAKDHSFFARISHGVLNMSKVLPIYEKYLCKILATAKTRRNTILVVAATFIIAVALPISGIVQSEFFPVGDFDYLFISVEAPAGLNLAETDKITTAVETKLLKYPDIENFSTIVGQGGSGGNGISVSTGSAPSNKSNITIKLIDKKKRSMKSYELAAKLRNDFNEIKDATVTVNTQSAGPPTGSAFEARIVGDDLQTLDKIAHELKPILESIKGTINIDISLKPSPADYTFTLDPARLELYNLNAAYVGSILRMAISGTQVTTVLKNGDEIKVMARFSENSIPTLESIENLQIINLRKQPVFLKDVAKISLAPSVNSITRIDQKRAVLLSAAADAKTTPANILKEFQDKMTKSYKLPEGYQIIYGGENESNAESVASIIRAMYIAGLLIISTLIIQFNSFKKSLIVLATIPFALIGVFFGLALTRINLSFPGLIGIVALFGIVVKNAIILIDKINLNIRFGIPFVDAIIDAGKSRLEAIFITSICTIIGIIPITLSNETWLGLGAAIIFGLMLSSFLTLFIVPVLYRMMVKENERL